MKTLSHFDSIWLVAGANFRSLSGGLERSNREEQHHVCAFCNVLQPTGNISVLTNLINEDDGWLEFDGQSENSSGQLLGFAVPFVCQRGGLQVDEAEAGFLCGGFGYQGLTTARGAVQKHTFKWKYHVIS